MASKTTSENVHKALESVKMKPFNKWGLKC
jgi:hypothetical protein